MNNQSVLVVDFGSQYNQLIVRKVREQKVSAMLISADQINEMIRNNNLGNVQAIILSGGPNVITDVGALKIDEKIFDIDIPILGICYGMQLISNYYGATLQEGRVKEYGAQQIQISNHDSLFKSLSDVEDVWMSHGWEVANPSSSIELLAQTNDNVIAAIKIKDRNIFGVQFHMEVTNTINGTQMLENFLKIANIEQDYEMENIIEQKVREIKDKVGDDIVICGLSGGVDSSVTASIINKAIGDNLKCIFVDNGLLRLNEVELVQDSLKELGLNIKVVDAKDEFLNALKGVDDPEKKRKIIGNLFIDIFERESNEYPNAKFLAQGTLYTDIIESGTSTAQTIKSHHNVGGLPEDMELKLIEPLNTLFKDEVRALGLELGLNEELINRQPFPGPGLSIRIIGEITKEKLDVVKQSDAIFQRILKEKGLSKDIWQSFTVLTNTKTVGVKGDERSYEYVLALRAITSVDGMTAKMSNIDIKTLQEISTEITNKVLHINRVVYDITNKPPATIEWE